MSVASLEPIADYPSSLVDSDGTAWVARALGRLRADGLWEGYLEFERMDGTAALRTERETTQPNLTDLLYWAAGLTPVYLEGAFGRAAALPAAEHILTASNTPSAYAAACSQKAAVAVADAPYVAAEPFAVEAAPTDEATWSTAAEAVPPPPSSS